MRLPNSASASSKSSMASPASAASKMRSRFFSVSPMYLLTTAARSTRYRSRPSPRAMTSAAMVLPVPLGPANSAPVARPRRDAAPSPTRRAPAPVPHPGTDSHSCASASGGTTSDPQPRAAPSGGRAPVQRLPGLGARRGEQVLRRGGVSRARPPWRRTTRPRRSAPPPGGTGLPTSDGIQSASPSAVGSVRQRSRRPAAESRGNETVTVPVGCSPAGPRSPAAMRTTPRSSCSSRPSALRRASGRASTSSR